MPEYIEISINIFDLPRQRAQVLRSLTVAELIEEILAEFPELDHENPAGYALRLKNQENKLDPQKTLESLTIQNLEELELIYAQAGYRSLPANQPAYLKETNTGEVFAIVSQPAVIGRPDLSDPTHNLLLAVNLKYHPEGQYVSRRQAQITFFNGEFFLEGLSERHPTFLNSLQNPITGKKLLKAGDKIIIGNNRVILQFHDGVPG